MTKNFINISNHPSSKWSDKQREAAGAEIIDVPFPNVVPNMGPTDLLILAKQVMQQVYEKVGKDAPYVDKGVIHVNFLDEYRILIQGEATLQTILVKLFKDLHAWVVCATSERKVQEVSKPDGSVVKTAVYEFAEFRDYILPDLLIQSLVS